VAHCKILLNGDLRSLT